MEPFLRVVYLSFDMTKVGSIYQYHLLLTVRKYSKNQFENEDDQGIITTTNIPERVTTNVRTPNQTKPAKQK